MWKTAGSDSGDKLNFIFPFSQADGSTTRNMAAQAWIKHHQKLAALWAAPFCKVTSRKEAFFLSLPVGIDIGTQPSLIAAAGPIGNTAGHSLHRYSGPS